MKVIDCFTLNGEYDMLEIRFNILNEYVDKFVICESPETFSGRPKPLYWADRNLNRFEEWENKVHYHVIEIPKEITNSFERAGYQKDSIRKALKDCDPEDVIIYGDIDEVPNLEVLNKEGKLRQLNYSYYLNNRSSEVWEGTNVCKYKNLYDLNKLRANHDVIIENGGWHFSNCFNFDGLINKLESYDHQECNIPWVRDGLQARMEANIDYLGRTADWQGKPFEMWVDETELPQYLIDNKDKWKHLWKQ